MLSRHQVTSLSAGLAVGALCALALPWIAPGRPGEATRTQPAQSASKAIRQPYLRLELRRRFDEYLQDRSRHRMLLLQEIISAYLRTDAHECLALLYSWNARALVAERTLGNPITHIDSDDFAAVFRMASECDGRTGDPLIHQAFQRLIKSNPEKALSYHSSLPPHLREDLAMELAKSWAASDGAAAADAFFRTNKVHDWHRQAIDGVFQEWAKTKSDAAYKHLLSLCRPGRDRDELSGRFFFNLGLQGRCRRDPTHGGRWRDSASNGRFVQPVFWEIKPR